MGILTPGKNETFVGWILRLTLYFVIFVAACILGTYLEDKHKPEPKPYGSHRKNPEPSRPASDVLHDDYSTMTVTYRDTGRHVPKGKKREKTSSATYGGKTVEEIFLDNDLANDYEELYEMYRD